MNAPFMHRLFGSTTAVEAEKKGLVIDPPLEFILSQVSDGLIFIGPNDAVLFVNPAALAMTSSNPSALISSVPVQAALVALRQGVKPAVNTEVDLATSGPPSKCRVIACDWPLGRGYILLLRGPDAGVEAAGGNRVAAPAQSLVDELLARGTTPVAVRRIIDQAWEVVAPLAAASRVRVILSDARTAAIELNLNEAVVKWAVAECLGYLLRHHEATGAGGTSHVEIQMLASSDEFLLAMILTEGSQPQQHAAQVELQPNPQNAASNAPEEIGRRFSLARHMLSAVGHSVDKVRGDDGWEAVLVRLKREQPSF